MIWNHMGPYGAIWRPGPGASWVVIVMVIVIDDNEDDDNDDGDDEMVMMIDIWGLTGPSGTIWDHMSPYRTI